MNCFYTKRIYYRKSEFIGVNHIVSRGKVKVNLGKAAFPIRNDGLRNGVFDQL